MSWVEDKVVFRGAIRRSGNSLVITIPAELSQRFLLREGQELLIYGISRKGPDFEGALQIYLGYFIVHEKLPVVKLKVKVDPMKRGELYQVLSEVERSYMPSMANHKQVEKDLIELEFMFGAITDGGIRRVRNIEEVKELASAIEFKLSSSGFQVLEKSIEEKIVEWRNVDPASISKAPHKLLEVVRWRWEI